MSARWDDGRDRPEQDDNYRPGGLLRGIGYGLLVQAALVLVLVGVAALVLVAERAL